MQTIFLKLSFGQGLHLPGVGHDRIRDLRAAQYPRQLLYALLLIQQTDPGLCGLPVRLLDDLIMGICHGSDLCQMRDADDLMLTGDHRHLLRYLLRGAPADAGIDLIKDQRLDLVAVRQNGLHGKHDGLYVLPPFLTRENVGVYNGTLDALRSNTNYLSRSKQEYVVLCNSSIICNPHMDRFIQYHVDSGAEITLMYTKEESMQRDEFGTYIMVSSSAVYPETEKQPFREQTRLGQNRLWGKYGTDKIEAEERLLKMVPDAYLLRPPYLYGPMNNVYREAFVFDCAMQDRPFYLPGEGHLPLQFFHVEDLCRLMETILEKRPDDHIINVGNEENVTVRDWVEFCYECAGKVPTFLSVDPQIDQRNYFCFYNYAYQLDVTIQSGLLENTKDLKEGLTECYEWYKDHSEEVNRKPFLDYIDKNF